MLLATGLVFVALDRLVSSSELSAVGSPLYQEPALAADLIVSIFALFEIDYARIHPIIISKT